MLMQDIRIRGVTFTGSVRGGRQVATDAGKNLKKSVMELGGSDAYLILADADVQYAAKICAQSRMLNNGQSCVAAKRFFVANAVHEEFLAAFSAHLRTYKGANPILESTIVGPLAHKKFQQQLRDQVASFGKYIFMETENQEGPGAFFAPMILQLPTQDKSWSEEFFGPVACVWSFQDEKNAVAQANNSSLGLGGAVFSRDQERAHAIALQMDCGMVAINDFVRSDARIPFGGVKDSGFGRELSHFGMREFVSIKTVTG
jgi:succinate-semialdehyde dehydrogenase/glutarate-semialdehyde dehydrogenase